MIIETLLWKLPAPPVVGLASVTGYGRHVFGYARENHFPEEARSP